MDNTGTPAVCGSGLPTILALFDRFCIKSLWHCPLIFVSLARVRISGGENRSDVRADEHDVLLIPHPPMPHHTPPTPRGGVGGERGWGTQSWGVWGWGEALWWWGTRRIL